MKYYLFTLGCQMNESDSQRIASVLDSAGFTPTDEKSADIIIANLCSVRQKGIDRVWGKLKVWENLLKKPKIYLTGCILAGDRRKFEKRVDGIFNISSLEHLPTLLSQKKPSAKLNNDNPLSYFDITPIASPEYPRGANTQKLKTLSYVPIMTGCDNFCSYCAVPYTRGREISRPKKEIITEIKNLIKADHRHILLLGQNVNSYNPVPKSHSERPALAKQHIRNPLESQQAARGKSQTSCEILPPPRRVQDDNKHFIDLLLTVDNLPGKFKFSFMSSNPHDMSKNLIATFAKLKKWDKTLHIAMQSGDDKILTKMNRKCFSAQFLNLIENLKLKIENLRLSTDIIVGFPTESKKAFLNTLKVCKKANFDKAYISMYSPRPGTVSAKLYKDDIPSAEKKRRWKILDDLINQPSKK